MLDEKMLAAIKTLSKDEDGLSLLLAQAVLALHEEQERETATRREIEIALTSNQGKIIALLEQSQAGPRTTVNPTMGGTSVADEWQERQVKRMASTLATDLTLPRLAQTTTENGPVELDSECAHEWQKTGYKDRFLWKGHEPEEREIEVCWECRALRWSEWIPAQAAPTTSLTSANQDQSKSVATQVEQPVESPSNESPEQWHIHEWVYKGEQAARARRVYGVEAGRAICACDDELHQEADWVVPDVFRDSDLESIITDHNKESAGTEAAGEDWGGLRDEMHLREDDASSSPVAEHKHQWQHYLNPRGNHIEEWWCPGCPEVRYTDPLKVSQG